MASEFSISLTEISTVERMAVAVFGQMVAEHGHSPQDTGKMWEDAFVTAAWAYGSARSKLGGPGLSTVVMNVGEWTLEKTPQGLRVRSK